MQLQVKACNFIKKETLAQVFSCEFCEISKNTLFTEHLWTAASDISLLDFTNDDHLFSFCILRFARNFQVTQPAFTCSKLTLETLEESVKYFQSQQ